MIRVRYSSELHHHGIKGQKWGVRRYQNEDGTLTPEGKLRYGVGTSKHSISRSNLNDPETKAYLEKVLPDMSESSANFLSGIVNEGGKVHFEVAEKGDWSSVVLDHRAIRNFGKYSMFYGRYGEPGKKVNVYVTNPNNTKDWKRYNYLRFDHKSEDFTEKDYEDYDRLEDKVSSGKMLKPSNILYQSVSKSKIASERANREAVRKKKERRRAALEAGALVAATALSIYAIKRQKEKDLKKRLLQAGKQPYLNNFDYDKFEYDEFKP